MPGTVAQWNAVLRHIDRGIRTAFSPGLAGGTASRRTYGPHVASWQSMIHGRYRVMARPIDAAGLRPLFDAKKAVLRRVGFSDRIREVLRKLFADAAMANASGTSRIWRGIADGIVVDFDKRRFRFVVVCTHFASGMKEYGGVIRAGRGRYSKKTAKFIPLPVNRTRPIKKAAEFGKLVFVKAPHQTKFGLSPGYLAPAGFRTSLSIRKRQGNAGFRKKMLFELVKWVSIPPDPRGGWLPKPHEISGEVARFARQELKR